MFSCPFRLSLAPTICPWVSEDDINLIRLVTIQQPGNIALVIFLSDAFFFRTEAKPEQRSRYCYIYIFNLWSGQTYPCKHVNVCFHLSFYLIGKGAIVAASVVPGIVVFSTIFLAIYFARKRQLMALNNGNSKLILQKVK